VRIFDRKFGARFLAGVPAEPGVYRLYDGAGTVLYVGKARDLRRRLAQYRTGRRTRDRKRRELVNSAARIVWDVFSSELEASLEEIRLIQSLRPRANVAGAFSFLYPFVGIHIEGHDTYFCLTTSPGAFPRFDLHGAYRSREVTGEGFFALMRLLRFVGHPIPRRHRDRAGTPPYSYVRGFRRLPAGWPAMWSRLLRGVSREPLERLALRLLDHAAARARSGRIESDLRAVERFFSDEASALARAIHATGYAGYPVPQHERDALFVRYRRLLSAAVD
jgi:predicted GIY-YIG superfamily endonuclease